MQELVLIDEKKLAFMDMKHRDINSDEIRVTAIKSAISHGTELNLYSGTSPFTDKVFDTQKRIFVAASKEHSYPLSLGYEWVGAVSEVGKDVQEFKVGDLVHLPLAHAQEHIVNPKQFVNLGADKPIAQDSDIDNLLFLNSAGIALQAIHDANIKLGDNIVIFGMGVLGLMATKMAKLSGAANVYAVDINEERRNLALKAGADFVIDAAKDDVGEYIAVNTDVCDTAVEFSGNYQALHQAIRSVSMGGRVVAAGFYQGEASGVYFGEEWMHNRITMVSSMQGWNNSHRNYPNWHRARLRNTAINLLTTINPKAYITDVYNFFDAKLAYEKLSSNRHASLKSIFKY